MIGGTISLGSLIYTKRQNSKREVQSRQFEKKAEAFVEIIALLNSVLAAHKGIGEHSEGDFIQKLVLARPKLVVWAGAEVIEAWSEMSNSPEGSSPAETLKRANDLFLAIRRELGHEDDKKLDNFGMVSIFLKPGELTKLRAN